MLGYVPKRNLIACKVYVQEVESLVGTLIIDKKSYLAYTAFYGRICLL